MRRSGFTPNPLSDPPNTRILSRKYLDAVQANGGEQLTPHDNEELPEWKDMLSLPLYRCYELMGAGVNDAKPWQGAFTRLFNARASPHALFGRLVRHADQLLTCLALTRSFLIGWYAVEYFVSGTADDQSTWDFCCIGNEGQYDILIRCMKHFGFEYTLPVDKFHDMYTPPADRFHGMPTHTGRIGSHKVRLIWDMSTTSPLETTARLPATIFACYVTGVNAVCLSPMVVANRASTHRWSEDHDSEYPGSNDTIQRLERNGVKFVGAEAYLRRLRAELGYSIQYRVLGSDTTRMAVKTNYDVPDPDNVDMDIPPAFSTARSSRLTLEVVFPEGTWSEFSHHMYIQRSRILHDLDLDRYEVLCRGSPYFESDKESLRLEGAVMPARHICKFVSTPEFLPGPSTNAVTSFPSTWESESDDYAGCNTCINDVALDDMYRTCGRPKNGPIRTAAPRRGRGRWPSQRT